MDPAERLRAVRVPVHLLHGRGDTLVPFTETLRMQRALVEHTSVRTTVSRLFAHAQEDDFRGALARAREGGAFVRAVGAVLRMGATG